MMLRRLQSSTTHPVPFYLVLASDHLTPATGLTPVVTLSKDGAAFGSAAGAVTERSNGWYLLAGNATDRGTAGTLLLRAAVATADDAYAQVEITAQDPFAAGVTLAATAVQAIWDAATSALTTSGSVGKLLTDNVNAAVGGVAAAVWAIATSTLTGAGTVGKKLADWVLGTDAKAIVSADSHTAGVTVAAVTTKTGYALTSGEHTTLASELHTQVANALTVDTIAELAQGAPASTPTIAAAIQLLYMITRNGIVEDGSYRKVYNDAGVCIAKWATSDDNLKFTVAKIVTGP